MSRRLTAKEIKHDIRQDEVRTFLMRIFDTLQERPGLVLALVVGVLLLALAVTGAYAYIESQREDAFDELAEAMKVYDAPIDENDAQPTDPDAPSFASEEERRQRAEEAFKEVRGLGAGTAGDVAKLYLADIALAKGDAETARKIWNGFLDDHDEHVMALSVRLNLIYLDRESGQAEAVAEELQQELDSAEKTLPEDVVLFELAQTREKLGQTDEARALYQRILDEHPQSPYAARARQLTTAAA